MFWEMFSQQLWHIEVIFSSGWISTGPSTTNSPLDYLQFDFCANGNLESNPLKFLPGWEFVKKDVSSETKRVDKYPSSMAQGLHCFPIYEMDGPNIPIGFDATGSVAKLVSAAGHGSHNADPSSSHANFRRISIRAFMEVGFEEPFCLFTFLAFVQNSF
jgi:hypothetical protein